MIEDVPTISTDATLEAAVVAMAKADLEYLVVVDDGDPTGLLTPRRALIGWIKTNVPIAEVPVSGFASGFPVTVEPDTPLLFAIGHFRRAGVDVLPVQDGLSIAGVVTRRLVAENLAALRDEAVHNAAMDRWVDTHK